MFQKLLKNFRDRVTLPIEVGELTAFLIQQGCQDSIILHPEEMDPLELRGAYVQYTTHPGVYAAPELVTLIIYPANAPVSDQRVICGKEVIHLCDGKTARTNSPEEVEALVEKLLGPLSTEDYGLADIMASVDRIALYQALALLFPIAARQVAIAAIAAGKVSIDQVAEWADLPLPLVRLVLSPEWEEVYAIIEVL